MVIITFFPIQLKNISGLKPTGRAGHQMCSIEGKIMMFGGINDVGKSLNEIFIFDLNQQEWSQVIEMKKPRWNHSISLNPSEHLVFVFGGINDAYDCFCNSLSQEVMILDTVTHKIKFVPIIDEKGNLPKPRSDSAVAFDPVRKRIIQIGGWSSYWEEEIIFIDISNYDFN